MAAERALERPEAGLAPGFAGLRRWAVWAVLVLVLVLPAKALAAPVDWHQLPVTAEGEQWWDAGSLRPTRAGTLTVLSRYRPAEVDGRQPSGHLVVMEINCDNGQYRDTWVDGLPRWRASWQQAAGEDLTQSVVEAACAAMARSPSLPLP